MKTINNDLIRSFKPCYDPAEHDIPDAETLSAVEWVSKYRGIVPDKDILWLLLREHFYSSKDLRLFAVWCARGALRLIDSPDPRSIEACNIAERYANGDATCKELASARASAWNAYVTPAACAAAWATHATPAAYAAVAWSTHGIPTAATYYDTARKQQLDYLLNNFIML